MSTILIAFGSKYCQRYNFRLKNIFPLETKEFYLYDSSIPKALYDKDIPVGNKKRTYEAVIRDWGACIVPWFWTNYRIEVTD